MSKKSDREGRNKGGPRLSRPRKRVMPHERKDDEVEASSASAKKIKLNASLGIKEDLKKHFRIIDFLLVFSTIATLVKCKTCNGEISFQSCKKEGLGFKIKVTCEKCEVLNYVPSSERIEGNAYEVNYRFAFVMRVLGLGLAGCEKFCGLMDIAGRFISKPAYNNYMKKMSTSIQTVANKYFASAVQEEKEETCKQNNLQDTTEITVSGDGTWKKRGFSSLFGISSLIGHWTGKVIDIFVKSSYCHHCATWSNKLDTAEYEEWYKEHVEKGECLSNHSGPSGNMEVEAIVKMFQRSMNLFKVKYRNYIGDGDSKTYTGVINAKPYGDNFIINKKECIGHVQKRMGYNQLIWKISPKSVSGTSNIVEIAAYVAACVFNEGSTAFLTFMQEMGITSGPSAHEWTRATDDLRISRADEQAALQTKEGRIQRRQEQKDALDVLDDSDILYGPGIDDAI